MIITYVLAAILGLCVGSFLNVVIYRVPQKMSIAKPASHCPQCMYKLRWYDNIPVISYILLGGKCRFCKKHIPIRYTIVEAANAVFWILCVYLFWDRQNAPYYAIIAALAISTLICIFFIDLEHKLIFDRFQLIMLALGVAALLLGIFDKPVSGYSTWRSQLIGCAVAGGFFLLMYIVALFVFKKEGLGFGDVKLAAVCGLFLGWQKIFLALLFASIVGSIVLICVRKAKNDEKQHEYPFAPFIVGGVILAMFTGDIIIKFYTSLFDYVSLI